MHSYAWYAICVITDVKPLGGFTLTDYARSNGQLTAMEIEHHKCIAQKLGTVPDTVIYDRNNLRYIVTYLLKELGWLRKVKTVPRSTFDDWLRVVAPTLSINPKDLPTVFDKEWVKELLYLSYWRKRNPRASLQFYYREHRG